jgi:hypothetical protein
MADSQRLKQLRRLRERLWPDAETITFDQTHRGFSPLPLVFRVLIRAFRQDQDFLKRGDFLVLTALYTFREGPLNMVAPDLDELAYTLGLSSRHKVTEPLARLRDMGFLREGKDGLRTWYLLCDPVHAIPQLHARGLLTLDDLHRVNDILDASGRAQVQIPPVAA